MVRGAVSGGAGATLPDLVPPMLPATGELSDATDPGRWAVEFGWEGHRCVAYVRPGRVRLLSSTARSVTGSFPELAVLADRSPAGGMVLDGTVVALDEAGRPSRGPLLRRTATLAPDDALRTEVPVGYVVTDLLWCDGRRILELPYRRRRAALEELDLAGPKILVPPSFGLDEAELVARTAERYGLDGLHLKRLDVPYQPGRRSRHWLRVPLRRRRQVLVAGWVPAGAGAGAAAEPGPQRRERIAAVLLALPGPDGPHYVGRVGVGAADADTRTVLRAPASGEPPLDVPDGIAENARWLAPGLVAAVEHRGRTAAGRLALPSWRGLVPAGEQDEDLLAEATASRPPRRPTGRRGAPGTGGPGADRPAAGPSATTATAPSATTASASAPEQSPVEQPGPWHGPLSRRLEQHFVYNTLNTIAALVRTDPPRARELLLGFADLSRAADRAEEPAIRLDEELAAVRAYLQIEWTRFGARLHAEVDDPGTAGADPAAAVPPLAVLAAVRRGVQEQIEPAAGGGALHVRLTAATCRVEVRPVQPGGDPAAAAGAPLVLLSLPLDVPGG
ncbi:ATP-dependent DNA ligase [Pseudonocardia parietis]|uniref:DNA ligase (ATP) n=1 Tax=Pseudonocardia parietis TaxID=570936 RepID=A0ABS4VXJ2_9PSEU|nr:histidine kinase [Pseudonocardia parietis]MBP2368199.1 bifunctional non-homologous end joining protein LigD [Pseudonocardia parietis]